MKKTLITLLALAGVGMGADDAPTSVWSGSYDLTKATKIDLSSLGLSTATGKAGYTLMLTFSNASVNYNASSILWLSSQETTYTGGNPYNQSTGTLSYTSGDGYQKGLRLANAANGSSTTGSTVWEGAGISDDSWNFGTTTIFMTSKEGTATLYELDTDGSLKLTSQNTGLLSADVKSMWIGNWAANGSIMSAGTGNMALFSGVLTETQMNSLMASNVPEPTTATLSLLALAGLAARRRRR